jgi:hypothetical protein
VAVGRGASAVLGLGGVRGARRAGGVPAPAAAKVCRFALSADQGLAEGVKGEMGGLHLGPNHRRAGLSVDVSQQEACEY